MKRFITQGEGIPPSAAPISQAVVTGNYCHVSGQLAIDSNGVYKEGTALEEGRLAFQNLLAVVKAAGFLKEDIVFVDIAFMNLGDLPTINALYDGLFEEGKKPARTIYQAAALPFGAKIKVLAIALKE